MIQEHSYEGEEKQKNRKLGRRVNGRVEKSRMDGLRRDMREEEK